MYIKYRKNKGMKIYIQKIRMSLDMTCTSTTTWPWRWTWTTSKISTLTMASTTATDSAVFYIGLGYDFDFDYGYGETDDRYLNYNARLDFYCIHIDCWCNTVVVEATIDNETVLIEFESSHVHHNYRIAHMRRSHDLGLDKNIHFETSVHSSCLITTYFDYG